MAALSAVQALAGLAGGFSTMNQVNTEVDAQNLQADVVLQESQRDAAQKAREVTTFQSRQAHQYRSSGVILQGTPLLMLEQTRSLGQQEVDALISRGKAQSDLLKSRAKILKNQGRASMFGSVLGAVGTGLNTYLTGRRFGLYGAQPQTGVNISSTTRVPYSPPSASSSLAGMNVSIPSYSYGGGR